MTELANTSGMLEGDVIMACVHFKTRARDPLVLLSMIYGVSRVVFVFRFEAFWVSICYLNAQKIASALYKTRGLGIS